MGPLLFVALHLVLYLLWWVPAQRERMTRSGGREIPFYYSGSIGDCIGFTFVAYAFGSIASVIEPTYYLLSGCFAVCIAYVLHHHWRRISKLSSVSLYTRDAVPTDAGIIHLVYVMGILVLVATVLLNWYALTTYMQAYYVAGLGVYAVTVCIDMVRGVV
jgi:hypothetical protein